MQFLASKAVQNIGAGLPELERATGYSQSTTPPKLPNRPEEMLSSSVRTPGQPAHMAPLSCKTPVKGLLEAQASPRLSWQWRDLALTHARYCLNCTVWHRGCTLSCQYFATGFPNMALICWNNRRGQFSTNFFFLIRSESPIYQSKMQLPHGNSRETKIEKS